MIYGFHHICFEKNGKEILKDQINSLKTSGLYDATNTIYCSVLGNMNGFKLPEKYKIIHQVEQSTEYERKILEFIHNFSKTNDVKVWYIHTKGISHYGTEKYKRVYDWRKYMEHFLINRWNICNKDLDKYDIAGVNFTNNPPHFSGNFWWAKTKYLRSNPTNFNYKEYCETEMWLFKGKIPPYGISYHQSNINHYEKDYSPENYINKAQDPLIVYLLESGKAETVYDIDFNSLNNV